jgi:DNA-binding MarR family transcriptional regulator
MTGRESVAGAGGRPDDESASCRDLAVVLHDLAWLLPRTVGAEAMRVEPQPPTALEVMRLLSRRPGLSVNEVARELGIAANNVSTAVGHLSGEGLLERRRDPRDGRIVRLHPTDAALVARHRREQSWGRSMVAALADLDGREVESLISAAPALRRLAERLAVDDPGDGERATASP